MKRYLRDAYHVYQINENGQGGVISFSLRQTSCIERYKSLSNDLKKLLNIERISIVSISKFHK